MANLPAGRTGRRTTMIFYVYAIKSVVTNYIYVGLTNNIHRRILEHNNGENRSTKAYKPFTIVYSESFNDRKTTRLKEKYLKSGVGKEFLKKI